MAEVTQSAALGALQNIEPRAERADSAEVVETYVEHAQLQAALTSTNNQVIFGRRGTGKTHALRYLSERVRQSGDLSTYISMDRLGSTQGLYSDDRYSVSQRGVRLLVDAINALVTEFYAWSYDAGNEDAFNLCDALATAVNSLRVDEELTLVDDESSGSTRTSSESVKATISDKPSLGINVESKDEHTYKQGSSTTHRGKPFYRVHVGAAGQLVEDIISALNVKRVWILLDEWSELPLDLQPLLADMLRKVFFGIPSVTVKIAAIAHRANLYVATPDGRRVGLDVGGDIFGAIDLDEFVVFPAKSRRVRDDTATDFFRSLLYKHVQHALAESGGDQLVSENQFVSLCFTQITALTEVARAAEGVPRDGIGIAARSALKAHGRISTENVREAAYLLFQSQKLSSLNGSPEATRLLDKIIDTVIGEKKARAFILRQDFAEHPVIGFLLDERLLHLIKRGYSAQDRPGERYDIFQIDYGCYVSLLSTNRAPESLLGETVDGDLDQDHQYNAVFSSLAVPEHDNRAVRRAIVDLPLLMGVDYESMESSSGI